MTHNKLFVFFFPKKSQNWHHIEMIRFKMLLCLIFLMAFDNLEARKWFWCGHQAWVAPQALYVKRTREGGAWQTGAMGGVELGYERLYRNAPYWGIDGYTTYGCLTGRDGADNQIKSHLIDNFVEGRVGYTLRCRSLWKLTFTPTIGYGYFHQTNHFVDPSPIDVKIRNTFHFSSVGFIASIEPNQCWQLSTRFKAHWLVEGKSTILDDPEEGDVVLPMQDEWQFVAEFPISYRKNWGKHCFNFRFTPFYRHRHYGGQPGFPFDFMDTKYNLWGASLGITYLF